ncbi:unnamed protein product [Chrysoparadoxa australica]
MRLLGLLFLALSSNPALSLVPTPAVPGIQDLVNSGVVQIWTRSPTYKERRSDGYQEPEEVYVVGTSHVSRQSAADVTRVIEAVQPQSVVVELCKSRLSLLSELPEGANGESLLGLSGDSFATAFLQQLQSGGGVVLLLRFLLAKAAGAGAGAGERPGADFRAAAAGADALDIELVLGDRPLEITLKRTWSSLTWQEKAKLMLGLWGVLSGSSGGSEVEGSSGLAAAVKKGRLDGDAVDGLIEALGEELPSAVGPLLTERDRYLAWSLKRSRAVGGKKRVVGVIGRGHMSGVLSEMRKDGGGDKLAFQQLVKVDREPALTAGLRVVVEIVFWWEAWRVCVDGHI